jgi:hypothetical protein
METNTVMTVSNLDHTNCCGARIVGVGALTGVMPLRIKSLHTQRPRRQWYLHVTFIGPLLAPAPSRFVERAHGEPVTW